MKGSRACRVEAARPRAPRWALGLVVLLAVTAAMLTFARRASAAPEVRAWAEPATVGVGDPVRIHLDAASSNGEVRNADAACDRWCSEYKRSPAAGTALRMAPGTQIFSPNQAPQVGNGSAIPFKANRPQERKSKLPREPTSVRNSSEARIWPPSAASHSRLAITTGVPK